MGIIYLTFANDEKYSLKQLKRERDGIMAALRPLEQGRGLLVKSDERATQESVARDLIRFQDELEVFYYSGHADGGQLNLEEGGGSADGIVTMLKQCERLQLVVLNGCGTAKQVQLLKDVGVDAAVIATNSRVNDVLAADFGIALWESLTVRAELLSAFLLAVGRVKLSEPLLGDEERGFASSNESTDSSQWMISADEFGQKWKLGTGGFSRAPDYEVNEILLRRLLSSMAPFSDSMARFAQEMEENPDFDMLRPREELLKLYPYPVGEQLRKMICPPLPHEAENSAHYQPGAERLQYMVMLYQTLMEMMCFIMLGQLWDEKKLVPELQLLPKERTRIEVFFNCPLDDRYGYDYVAFIRIVRELFDRYAIGYFVEELAEIKEYFKQESSFAQACSFFRTTSQLMFQKKLDNEASAVASLEAEGRLADILEPLAFLARYTFASVKGIEVVNYRHSKSAKFRHRGEKLNFQFTGLEKLNQLEDDYAHAASVLVMRKDEEGKVFNFLNLTPFIIDENVFLLGEGDKTNQAKLYFYQATTSEGVYAFRHIFKPTDPPLAVRKQKHFRLLKQQFAQFEELFLASAQNTAL